MVNTETMITIITALPKNHSEHHGLFGEFLLLIAECWLVTPDAPGTNEIKSIYALLRYECFGSHFDFFELRCSLE